MIHAKYPRSGVQRCLASLFLFAVAGMAAWADKTPALRKHL